MKMRHPFEPYTKTFLRPVVFVFHFFFFSLFGIWHLAFPYKSILNTYNKYTKCCAFSKSMENPFYQNNFPSICVRHSTKKRKK